MTETGVRRLMKITAVICALVCAASIVSICVAALYAHPYFDDYTFTVSVHKTWEESHSLLSVLRAALESSRSTRDTWQGTYTGTFLSNLQPSIFSERLYAVNVLILLFSLVFCVAYFCRVLFSTLGVGKDGRITLTSLLLTLMIQFMPDVGEAFFWFNGSIGNTFIIGLLFLSFALSIRLTQSTRRGKTVGLMALLALLMILLGGGSYGGGLMGLCLYALWTGSLIYKKHPRRWHFLGLWLLFLGCFLYSVSAPGNYIRSLYIDYREGTPLKAVAQALYYGTALIGSQITLLVLAATLVMLPFFIRAAGKSSLRFGHPWVVTVLLAGLYCSQLCPTMYSGVFMGGMRTIDALYECFLLGWFVWIFYMTGFCVRFIEEKGIALPALNTRRLAALLLTACVLMGLGCCAFRHSDEELYGIQNMTTPAIALSWLKGEMQTYNQEMLQREETLKSADTDTVALKPLTTVPSFFMPDLLAEGTDQDTLDNLCNMLQRYYDIEHVIVAPD